MKTAEPVRWRRRSQNRRPGDGRCVVLDRRARVESPGDLDGDRLELRQGRVHPASAAATKTVMTVHQNQTIHLGRRRTPSAMCSGTRRSQDTARLLLPWDKGRDDPDPVARKYRNAPPRITPQVDPSVRSSPLAQPD